MPTSLPPAEKTAFIAIVNVYSAMEATRLASILNTFDDIVIAIGRQLPTIASNQQLLKELMGVFVAVGDPAELLAAGIVYNLTNATVYSSPKLIINSTLTGGAIFNSDSTGLGILGVSTVASVATGPGAVLDNLYIAPGSTLSLLDSRATDSLVSTIYLPFLNSMPATLTEVATDSNIGSVKVDNGSYYGGKGNVIPLPACANPVTTLAVNDITHNSVRLSWVPPANFLFINVTYRKKDAGTWIPVKQLDGDYIDSTGYIFRSLDGDTNYDFQVIVTCVAGGYSAPVVISGKTDCCS